MSAAATEPIWRAAATRELVDGLMSGTLAETLGMHCTEVGDDYVAIAMPVDRRTVQPMGLLHGGASAALAETLGSVGANMTVDTEREICVGIELNANHLRAVRDGTVVGTARPLHRGRQTQVWEIRIVDADERLVCVARLTLSVVARHG